MSQFIDRRLNGKNKSMVNRQRFIRRFKNQIKNAVSDAISGRSITDISTGEKISIPKKDISEPHFHHGTGGRRDVIHPGNKEFIEGDKIKRPPSNSGKGNGGQASKDGEGEDEFGFEISRDEFLDIFFDNLELPNLVKRKIKQLESYNTVKAGFTSEGIPANINIVRSLRGAIGRRKGIAGSINKRIKELEKELLTLANDDPKASFIEQEIQLLKKKKKSIPFIDTFDLRYNNRVLQPSPSTSAVMFCLMDVSGSMDEAKKDIAKRFFILLYLFLNRTYKKIEVVFIRHHTSAKEVNEQDFFYSRETGGTVVSSALELMNNIIDERYPSADWNIYAAQASDGDNWNNDTPKCKELIENYIMPNVQYFSYVEIMPRHHQSLWEAYHQIASTHKNFAIQHIENANDIYPVFRKLFTRQTT